MPRRDRETANRIEAACDLTPTQFVEEYLLHASPYAFRSAPAEYENFTVELGSRLGVPATDLLLVGSGRLGFSLNPDHLLRPFGSASDLDMVIVSSQIFDNTWTELIESASDISLASDNDRRRLKRTQENFFRGYLRPDHLPLSITLATEWFPKLASRFSSPVASAHEVKGWLFKSVVHARAVYVAHLARVRPAIRRMVSFQEN